MSSQVTSRFSRLSLRAAKAPGLPFGLSAAEIIVAALALFCLVGALSYYFSGLRPEQERLEALRQQYESEKRELDAEKSRPPVGQSAAKQAEETLVSLNAFKEGRLKSLGSGRIALFEEINALARKNGVQLESGIDMQTEGLPDKKKPDEPKRGGVRKREQFRFPSLEISFTVVGTYDKLREFIGQLQYNKQFLVINAVNLVADEAAAGTEGGGRSGRRAQRTGALSLTIGASAYFRPIAAQG